MRVTMPNVAVLGQTVWGYK